VLGLRAIRVVSELDVHNLPILHFRVSLFTDKQMRTIRAMERYIIVVLVGKLRILSPPVCGEVVCMNDSVKVIFMIPASFEFVACIRNFAATLFAAGSRHMRWKGNLLFCAGIDELDPVPCEFEPFAERFRTISASKNLWSFLG
jgi:hypothetical protein